MKVTKLIKAIAVGVMYGFAMMTISLLFVVLLEKDLTQVLTKESILKSILASAVVGVSFNVGSLIYANNKLSGLMQTIIHMGVGMAVFFLAALYANWIPLNAGVGAIIGFVVFAFVGAFMIWGGFLIYYKHEAKKINEKLKTKPQA